jgi:hypothetical protein
LAKLNYSETKREHVVNSTYLWCCCIEVEDVDSSVDSEVLNKLNWWVECGWSVKCEPNMKLFLIKVHDTIRNELNNIYNIKWQILHLLIVTSYIVMTIEAFENSPVLVALLIQPLNDMSKNLVMN